MYDMKFWSFWELIIWYFEVVLSWILFVLFVFPSAILESSFFIVLKTREEIQRNER